MNQEHKTHPGLSTPKWWEKGPNAPHVHSCKVCGEESGGAGTSMYGYVHKWGPTTHEFKSCCEDKP